MSNWIRFINNNKESFGTLDGNDITVYEGNLFDNPTETDLKLMIEDVTLTNPCKPSKMIALWNNYQLLATEKGLSKPKNPLYLNKAISCIIDQGENIIRPKTYSENIFFEGELGIVIGRSCKDVAVKDIENYIFGYTCINDVTAMDLVKKDPTFDQWTRSKSYDTFGIFGPCITNDVDPMSLSVTTTVDGKVKQDYKTSDMFFNVYEIVSFLSHDMTLNPGDIIACGTNSGLGPMVSGETVTVSVSSIGKVVNKLI
ncbi:fumarylacetoacetate hydrolase family protein [Gammaproteobacteria bacterium]|nr:fumarylacetoacetate hydrolase family protein [Gammaproteobacteria bacterium]